MILVFPFFVQGIWKPRKIPNPHYFEDLNPFRMTSFSAIGLELWSMTSDIYFDNFIICTEKEVADRWASDSWGLKKLVASANEVCYSINRGECICSVLILINSSYRDRRRRSGLQHRHIYIVFL